MSRVDRTRSTREAVAVDVADAFDERAERALLAAVALAVSRGDGELPGQREVVFGVLEVRFARSLVVNVNGGVGRRWSVHEDVAVGRAAAGLGVARERVHGERVVHRDALPAPDAALRLVDLRVRRERPRLELSAKSRKIRRRSDSAIARAGDWW